MSRGQGCLKNGCLGCLGLLVLMVVILGANAIIVMKNNGNELIEDRMVGSAAGMQNTPEAIADLAPAEVDKPEAGKGWLILELAQGEFQLHRGEPGEGVVVKASYDSSTYELLEYSHTWADSAWVYHVDFHRTISGLQAMLREVMGGNHAPSLHVYLPPDLPLELNILVKEGGMEAELGGLWLTDVDLRYDKGGFVLGFDEPLREPLNSLAITGRMGGAEVREVGNASPALLDVDCRMGGMELDLHGAWSRDCDASVKLFMGGMEVSIPDNIDVEGAGLESGPIRRTDDEVARPVLRLQQQVKAGEIEIR